LVGCSEALLEKEKELSRLRDRISAERRALPWVKIETPYTFEGASDHVSLADLFAGRSQLIVYHCEIASKRDPGHEGRMSLTMLRTRLLRWGRFSREM
jgi:predicted dithiol-disulfide oxidoreductase (DUF899 family)